MRILRKHFHDAVIGAFGVGSAWHQKLTLNQWTGSVKRGVSDALLPQSSNNLTQ
jgi:hypothetical protein